VECKVAGALASEGGERIAIGYLPGLIMGKAFSL
jgi:hypothetical protein